MTTPPRTVTEARDAGFAALVAEARANHIRWEHDAEVLEECNRPLCLGARVLLWPDPDAPRTSALARSDLAARVEALEGALTMVLWLGHIQDDGLSICPCKVHRTARALLSEPEAPR